MRSARQRVREQEMAKQLQALREENDRLRAALRDVAAEFPSGPFKDHRENMAVAIRNMTTIATEALK